MLETVRVPSMSNTTPLRETEGEVRKCYRGLPEGPLAR